MAPPKIKKEPVNQAVPGHENTSEEGRGSSGNASASGTFRIAPPARSSGNASASGTFQIAPPARSSGNASASGTFQIASPARALPASRGRAGQGAVAPIANMGGPSNDDDNTEAYKMLLGHYNFPVDTMNKVIEKIKGSNFGINDWPSGHRAWKALRGVRGNEKHTELKDWVVRNQNWSKRNPNSLEPLPVLPEPEDLIALWVLGVMHCGQIYLGNWHKQVVQFIRDRHLQFLLCRRDIPGEQWFKHDSDTFFAHFPGLPLDHDHFGTCALDCDAARKIENDYNQSCEFTGHGLGPNCQNKFFLQHTAHPRASLSLNEFAPSINYFPGDHLICRLMEGTTPEMTARMVEAYRLGVEDSKEEARRLREALALVGKLAQDATGGNINLHQ